MEYNGNAAFQLRTQLNCTQLHVLACFDTPPEDLQNEIDSQPDINAVDTKGFTALHYAVTMNQPPNAKLLLEAGARTDIKSAEGQTPLELALSMELTELVEILQTAEE